MIKKLLLAAGATTILAAAAMMGQITRVRADFTVAPPSCTLGSVDVSASANRHTYKYDLNCDDNSSYHVGGAIDPGAGFVCDAAPFSSTIHCGGGTLAQGQSDTIAFHAFASTAGNAKLLLSINPNNSVAESNTDNNSAALDVTIQ
jgi:hypothetical protein